MCPDAAGDRPHIGRSVIIRRKRPDGGLPAQRPQAIICRVEGRRRRSCGILRIKGCEQDAVAAALAKVEQARGDRRLAVAHAPLDDQIVAVFESILEPLALLARDRLQGRLVARLIPDFGIGAARSAGTRREHDAVEDDPPNHPVGFDDPRIGEELFEIAPRLLEARTFRRPEIYEQHADLSLAAHRTVGSWMWNCRVKH